MVLRETTTSTLDVILLRIIDRLVEGVSESTTHNTWLSTLPNPPPTPSGTMFEVSPGENFEFEEVYIVGGGKNMMHTKGQVKVTIHSTLQLDQVGRDVQFLTNASKGILQQVTAVLDALADYDLQDKQGNSLLSQPIHPAWLSVPPKDDRARGYVTIGFNIEFDWALTKETAPVETDEGSDESSHSTSSSSLSSSSLSSSSSSSVSSSSSSSVSSISSSSISSSISSSSGDETSVSSVSTSSSSSQSSSSSSSPSSSSSISSSASS